VSEKPARRRRPIEIYLEHVRSFARGQWVPVRPLTLLVGENSSGKSTFLATVAAVLHPQRFPFSPPFNDPPYNVETYDTIATYKAGTTAICMRTSRTPQSSVRPEVCIKSPGTAT
jgi:energy-coupling factor transporter ATP-binding protein EcfA2